MDRHLRPEIGKSHTPSCRSRCRVLARPRNSRFNVVVCLCCFPRQLLETVVSSTSSSSATRSFLHRARCPFRESADEFSGGHHAKEHLPLGFEASRDRRCISVISRSPFPSVIIRESPGYFGNKALPPSIGTRLKSRSHFRSTVRTTRPRGFTSSHGDGGGGRGGGSFRKIPTRTTKG
jgi:hypothetical protein